jgi:hypothetical protein
MWMKMKKTNQSIITLKIYDCFIIKPKILYLVLFLYLIYQLVLICFCNITINLLKLYISQKTGKV